MTLSSSLYSFRFAFTCDVVVVVTVANRVLSVGDAARGERVAQHFDHKKYFKHVSHRGFVVYTGFVKGVRMCAVVL